MPLSLHEVKWIQRILRPHGIKYCPRCEEIKALEDFSSHLGNRYTSAAGEDKKYLSFDSKCKDCKSRDARLKRWDSKAESRLISASVKDIKQPECMKQYEIRQLELKLVQPSRETVHSYGD